MNEDPVIRITPLGFPWETPDPFLFCVHHEDAYPAGNAGLGPAASLAGRDLGRDFAGLDGWRMYHGETVPGFPAHPHRGFETVTVVRRGWVDHADSLGAAGRYSDGDTQWMTAGRGVQHAEMFPLLYADRDNPLELFQIWLNLPAAGKMAEPRYAMFWRESQPRFVSGDGGVTVEIIAGEVEGIHAPVPPPPSWAADPGHHVAIWVITLAPGAAWTLPVAGQGLNRSLYFHRGTSLRVAGREIAAGHGLALHADRETLLENGDGRADLLLLQGRPIAEPVAHYGPFVMNTREELEQAFADYRRTEFGGWPWPRLDPVHPPERGRFARYADGREEEPNESEG
jgi:redox-sensitive bicupin YhaK (pirin superfamily)